MLLGKEGGVEFGGWSWLDLDLVLVWDSKVVHGVVTNESTSRV